MPWTTARAALAWLLSSAADEVSIDFNGGEPLLNAATLRRAVGFVERNRLPGTRVSYTVTTNGTLLREPLATFLFDRGFTVRLSFDGVEASQRIRGEGTFRALDRLLDRLRERHPAAFATQVRILVTVVAAAIPQLAESVRYLMGKGVGAIEIGPPFTAESAWSGSSLRELERQVDEVVHDVLARWRGTGEIPVTFLTGVPRRDLDAARRERMCGAPLARALTVDPAGRAWACPLFATSLRRLPPPALRPSRVLDLGPIGSRSFERRLASLPRSVGRFRLFRGRLEKRSSYRACADCRFLPDCQVCPASIFHVDGGRDPDRVPDFICAFNYVTLAARERFDVMTGGQVSGSWRRRLRELVDALEKTVGVPLDRSAARRPSERSLRSAQQQRRGREQRRPERTSNGPGDRPGPRRASDVGAREARRGTGAKAVQTRNRQKGEGR